MPNDGLHIDNFLRSDFLKVMPKEFISSMLVMIVIIILTFIVYFKGKKYQPFEKPKGIVNIFESLVEFAEKQIDEMMGKDFRPLTGYILGLGLYIFFSFIIGLIGIPNFIVVSNDAILNSSTLFTPLPNPFTNLAIPLSIAFMTIILIQIYGFKYKKWGYFKKFVSPIPFVEFITMWIPMLSLTLRLFGNAFAGFCIITLAYCALEGIGNGFGLAVAPILTPIAHAYFDVFDGLIQTVVFLMVTMLNIATEKPDEDEKSLKLAK